MKAISLWEPWASLMRTGAKTIETRGWYTQYRGEILICAAKGGLSKKELTALLYYTHFQAGLLPLIGKPLSDSVVGKHVDIGNLNFGKAVAIVNLVDCIPTVKMDREEWREEGQLGDFSPGRYAWITKMVRNDFVPFPIRGRQGLFNVPDSDLNISF